MFSGFYVLLFLGSFELVLIGSVGNLKVPTGCLERPVNSRQFGSVLIGWPTVGVHRSIVQIQSVTGFSAELTKCPGCLDNSIVREFDRVSKQEFETSIIVRESGGSVRKYVCVRVWSREREKVYVYRHCISTDLVWPPGNFKLWLRIHRRTADLWGWLLDYWTRCWWNATTRHWLQEYRVKPRTKQSDVAKQVNNKKKERARFNSPRFQLLLCLLLFVHEALAG